MIEEIWKDITGYEGLYQVSNLGRVKSLGNGGTFKKEHILKYSKNNRGYLQVQLCKDGKIKHFLIHRLVALQFLDNPNNYGQVNHKDFNKQNNCVFNLEFCDNKYNTTYSRGKSIKCFDLELSEETIYPSLREAERQLNIQHASIRRSINRQYPCKNRFLFTEINI